jgi:hypothetical protein
MSNINQNVKVLGQVKDGKLVLDAETLKRIGGATSPSGDTFRPVNAPFDSRPLEEAAA